MSNLPSQPPLPRDVVISDIEAALDLIHDIEDRVVRARMEGKRARLSIDTATWSTLRDTLIAALQNARR